MAPKDQGECFVKEASMSEEALEDLTVMMMGNFERALRFTGAVAGVDYTRMDLFKAALPFVLSMFEREGSKVCFDMMKPLPKE